MMLLLLLLLMRSLGAHFLFPYFLSLSLYSPKLDMIILYGLVGFGIISAFAAAVTYILCK